MAASTDEARGLRSMFTGWFKPVASSLWGWGSNYKAASQEKPFDRWNPSRGSADADLLPENEEITARARDLDRNEPLAAGALSTQAYSVVGSGLRVIPQPDYVALGKTKEWADEWSRVVRSKARAYFNSTDCDAARTDSFGAMQSLILMSVMMNGGALVLPVYLESGQTVYGTAFHPVEIDRLSNPNGEFDRMDLRGGIEIDRYGAPQAYHVRTEHPGDVALGLSAWEDKWERIPAFTEWGRRKVIHVFDRRRIGQSRGVSIMSSVIPEFNLYHRYRQAELEAALANALVVAFMETTGEFKDIAGMFNSPEEYFQAQAEAGSPKLKSGSVIPVFPGQKANFFTPNRPNPNMGPFLETVARHIATGLDMPLELITKNFSNLNYSSARTAILEAWRAFTTRREWLGRRFCTPCYELWFEEAVELGEIPDCTPEDLRANWGAWTACRWIGPGKGWVDPTKEAEAARLRLLAGISTLEKECAEQGDDWVEIAEQQRAERAYYARLGIPYPTDSLPTAKLAGNPDAGLVGHNGGPALDDEEKEDAKEAA